MTDTKPTRHIRRYYPAAMSGYEEEAKVLHPFTTLEELLALPWVKNFAHDGPEGFEFLSFGRSREHLLACYAKGVLIVGTFVEQDPIEGLNDLNKDAPKECPTCAAGAETCGCQGSGCPDCGPCHCEGLEQEAAEAKAEKEAVERAKQAVKTHLTRDEQLAVLAHTQASCGEAIKSLIRGVPVLTGFRELLDEKGEPKFDSLAIADLDASTKKACRKEEDILSHIVGYLLAQASGGKVMGYVGKTEDGRHTLTFLLGEPSSDAAQTELPLEKVDSQKA